MCNLEIFMQILRQSFFSSVLNDFLSDNAISPAQKLMLIQTRSNAFKLVQMHFRFTQYPWFFGHLLFVFILNVLGQKINHFFMRRKVTKHTVQPPPL